jgi:hypothetical protein
VETREIVSEKIRQNFNVKSSPNLLVQEIRYAPRTEEANLPHLSATVLDRGLEDLNNLYKTISRKRILSKARAASNPVAENRIFIKGTVARDYFLTIY